MISTSNIYLSLLATLVLLGSCVSYKPKYKGQWERSPSVDNPYFTVYLIGDGGNAPLGESTAILDHLKSKLDKESSSSAIIWLGDNIYPVGLAPSSSPYFPQGHHRLMAQLRTMSDYQGYKYVIPGNHDWYTYGRIGLRRQEMLVDSFLSLTPNPNHQDNFFLPDKGCGDPQIHEVAEDIGIVLMDTHWFLNEKVRGGDLSVCEVQSPGSFLDKLASLISDNDDKSLIIAAHHPPYTYAHHGGRFPLNDDLFPLTQKIKWLYLPMPLTGYVFNRVRLRVSEQDVYHPLYQAYRNRLTSSLVGKGSHLIVSGHEHTLQHIENDDQYYIVSGAGSKSNKVAMGKGSKFAIGAQGYVKLTFITPKEVIAHYIVPGQFPENNDIAYEVRMNLQ